MYREVEKIQNAIMTDGPVEAAFTVYADFENYVSGVYQHKVAQIPRLRLLFCYNLSITLARYIPRLPANLCTPSCPGGSPPTARPALHTLSAPPAPGSTARRGSAARPRRKFPDADVLVPGWIC